MAEDLWGELPAPDSSRTPHAILLEQSQLLTKKTDGLLVGRVNRGTTGTGSGFYSVLQIFAPSLQYSYNVLTLYHDVTLYPVTVEPSGSAPNLRAENQNDLIAALAHVLSSEQVRKVITGLLTQIRADDGADASK